MPLALRDMISKEIYVQTATLTFMRDAYLVKHRTHSALPEGRCISVQSSIPLKYPSFSVGETRRQVDGVQEVLTVSRTRSS